MPNRMRRPETLRKYQEPIKSSPTIAVRGNIVRHVGGNSDSCPLVENDGFFDAITKAAGLTTKDIQYDLRVSDTLIKLWKNGERTDPLLRARQVVDMFRDKRRADLIPPILIFIAGGFDGAVLTSEQFEALKILTKAVKE